MRFILNLHKLALGYILAAKCCKLIFVVAGFDFLVFWNRFFCFICMYWGKRINLIDIMQKNISLGKA